MKMRTRKINILNALLLSLTLVLGGCWKEDFDDCPQTGRITLTTEWDNRGAGVQIPPEYHAGIGSWSGTLTGVRNVINHDFAPGDHHVNIYNDADKIAVSGTTGTVAAAGAGIDAMPGFLFTYAGEATGLHKNESREIIAPMKQQVGEVTYEIVMEDGSDIREYISGISMATIDGIASRIDLETGALSAASNIAPAFTLDGGRYLASSRILGTVGAVQTFNMEFGITNAVGTFTLSKDISPLLAGFNDSKAGKHHILIVIHMSDRLPGEITLTTEWENRGAGVGIPPQYRAQVGSYSGVLSGITNVLDHDFTPGDHYVNVYTMPENISINGLTAAVDATGTGINALPGFLFTYAGDVHGLKKNESREILAPMTQQVGVVTYEIVTSDGSPVTNYISAVTSATVEGIASRIDLETAELSAASSIAPVFALDGNRYFATSRILGTIGGSQMLTINYSATGAVGTHTLSRDIAVELEGFNNDKAGEYHVRIVIYPDSFNLPGRITLITEWEPRGAGVDIPGYYQAIIGDYSGVLSGVRNVINHDFAPGTHHVNVYNFPEKISISGKTASVAWAGATLENMPGVLFTYSGEVVDLKKNEHREILAPMKQQVGAVTYEIVMEDGSDISDYISSIHGVTVDGIASSIDIETGALSGPASIAPAFTLSGGKYVSSSRILGTVGASQTFRMQFEITGAVGTHTLTKDITSLFEGFNANKTGNHHILVIIHMSDGLPGEITLTTQWNDRGAGVAIPSGYRAVVGHYSGMLTGITNVLDYDFAPGDHHVNVYTTPGSIEINGMVADVAAAGTGFVNAMPGFLFTYTGDATGLLKNEKREILAPMTQQVGTVTYEIVMADGSPVGNFVSAVDHASLSGVASRINLETGALSNPSSIALPFSPDGNRYAAESRILGILGTTQTLSLRLTLAGSGETQTLSRNIQPELVNFNAAKSGAYHIVIRITNIDSLTGRIIGWETGGGLTGEIN